MSSTTTPTQAPIQPQITIPTPLPRITITYCTQCRWLLRAAYFAQELLSTFGTSLGEVSLQPTTGGVFRVYLFHLPPTSQPASEESSTSSSVETSGEVREERGAEVRVVQEVLLWDRKAEGGFPETKVLKQRVRDCIEPGRDLGHSDRGGKKEKEEDQKVKKEDGVGEAPCA